MPVATIERARRNDQPDTQTQQRRHRPDYWLLIISLALMVISLVVIYAISPALGMANHVSDSFFITRQAIAIALGLVAFYATSRIPISRWRKWHVPLLVFAGLATAVALVMPANPLYPAHRWIRLGSLSFQSVELLKFALLVWLAGMLSDRIRKGTITQVRGALKPLMIAIVLVGAVVAGVQSDLGSTGVIVVMMGVMAFIAGMPMKKLLTVGAIVLTISILAIASTPYRRDRLMTFVHPTADCQNAGYQACQALISVGSGGLIGLGLGRSVQAYGYLPEAANDSIFAIYAEKFGFIGVAILLGLFTAFFARLKSLAERAPSNFTRLIIIGILTWLAVQTIMNIGAMIGLLPLKGITLPLVSYGGTSVVFVMGALGIVFQISRYTNYANVSMERRRVVRRNAASRAGEL